MIRVLFKALLVIWPCLKSAVFKDRTIAEVVKENVHFTCLFGIIVVLSLVLYFTLAVLAEYKEENLAIKARADTMVCERPVDNSVRRKKIVHLLEEARL